MNGAVPPDKVHISSYYDEVGRCTSIDVCLNYDGISREDLTETIRSLFAPRPGSDPTTTTPASTMRHRELGQTEVIHVVSGADNARPGAPNVPTRADNSDPGATMTRLSFPGTRVR